MVLGAGMTRFTSVPGARITGSGVLESTRGWALGGVGEMVIGLPETSGTGVTFKLEGGPDTVGATCLAVLFVTGWAGTTWVTVSGASLGGVLLEDWATGTVFSGFARVWVTGVRSGTF